MKKNQEMLGLNSWQIAFRNMRYHKSKNILTGIAVFIITILLFAVPTVGRDLIDSQYAMVNELYPVWHALYRNVDGETAKKLSLHHDIGEYGLRSDVASINAEGVTGYLLCLDESAAKLMKVELMEGRLPEKENEIVVTPGFLESLGGKKGDTRITIPYQVMLEDGLDYTREKQFTICGYMADSEESSAEQFFISLVSTDFLQAEIPAEQIRYRFLFQLNTVDNSNTDEIEGMVKELADKFGISENDTNINTTYLGANYVDPVILPAIIVIMLIIMAAGIITIYSIYYVSMSQRVREFGQLKAIGAKKSQIKKIVLREGMLVAAAAVPLGLLVGTFLIKLLLRQFVKMVGDINIMAEVTGRIINNNEIPLYHPWIYLMAAVVTLLTVYLSLITPMRRAARISEIEAMRYQEGNGKKAERRKGYESLNIARLTRNNLSGNRKRTMITIVSMSMTGLFLMVIATALSCANPQDATDYDMVGQYKIIPNVEEGNKEHPELSWKEVQKNNPLNDTLKQEIEALDGVERVDIFSMVDIAVDSLEEGIGEDICGIPENCAGQLEMGIIKGKASYEDLKSGDKVIADQKLLEWYPDIEVGDRLTVTVHDGETDYEKELEIIAIGDYGIGLTEYNFLIMAKEAADSLASNNVNDVFYVMADKRYDEGLETQIEALVEAEGRMEMQSWQAVYDTWQSGMTITRSVCYIFLGMLGAICIMNMINTMINSVHVRKKELGMMQAIGMSDRQLQKMLQLEGMFYTVGTLVLSLGGGSLLSYPIFLWAKKSGFLSVSHYHYPLTAAVTITVVMIVVQIVLSLILGISVKKESLIERIRFSE